MTTGEFSLVETFTELGIEGRQVKQLKRHVCWRLEPESPFLRPGQKLVDLKDILQDLPRACVFLLSGHHSVDAAKDRRLQ